MDNTFPAKIVKIIDHDRVVINKGLEDGVKENQNFLIYEVGDEIVDPDTKESLGTLEIVKGTATVEHLQEKMTTLISNKFEYEEVEIIPQLRSLSFFLESGHKKRTNKHRVALNDPKVNDCAKPI